MSPLDEEDDDPPPKLLSEDSDDEDDIVPQAAPFGRCGSIAGRVRLADCKARNPRVSPGANLPLPRPEVALEAAAEAAIHLGAWQTDGSRHTVGQRMTGDPKQSPLLLEPREGRTTLRVCYLFSGVQRKASIAQELKKLCEAEGIGLLINEVDILVGGSDHDLLDKGAQERLLAEIGSGDYDVIILSPPCGTWSRANCSSQPGPKQCAAGSIHGVCPTSRRAARGGATAATNSSTSRCAASSRRRPASGRAGA